LTGQEIRGRLSDALPVVVIVVIVVVVVVVVVVVAAAAVVVVVVVVVVVGIDKVTPVPKRYTMKMEWGVCVWRRGYLIRRAVKAKLHVL
jgi:hypothetical protein